MFITLEPLRNWRGTQVTARRTQVDFAHFIKWLVDDMYADARLIHLVLDNLNTHTPAAFDKAFPPAEAHRLAQRVQFHYTPKHGSWLNMAEIELSVTSRQALAQRMPDQALVERAVTAWETERN